MSQNPDQPFRFLDLPTEIKEKIYIHLVVSDQRIDLSPTYPSTPSLQGPNYSETGSRTQDEPLYPTFPSSFLLSCVQIYQELSPIYFTHNNFTLTIRKHNDTHATFLSPDSSFRPNLLSIRTLRLIILRFGSKNYFAGTVVPILEECILNGKLRKLEVWVRDPGAYKRPVKDALGYFVEEGREMRDGVVGKGVEYDNWGLLRKLCRDPWLEKVSLYSGWVDEFHGEIVRNFQFGLPKA